MKSYGQLWERVTSPENLAAALGRVMKGRGGNRNVMAFAARREEELAALRAELLSGAWRPGPYGQFRVTDPKPPFRGRKGRNMAAARRRVRMGREGARSGDQGRTDGGRAGDGGAGVSGASDFPRGVAFPEDAASADAEEVQAAGTSVSGRGDRRGAVGDVRGGSRRRGALVRVPGDFAVARGRGLRRILGGRRRGGFGFEPRETGRKLEQHRVELPFGVSQQQRPVEPEQQHRLPPFQHPAKRTGKVPSAAARAPRRRGRTRPAPGGR